MSTNPIEISGSRDLTFYNTYREDARRRTCPVCGSKFKASKQWVYHIGEIYFCRWNHQMAWEKAHPKGKPRPRKSGSARSTWYITSNEWWKENEEGCIARISYCEKKIREYTAKCKRYEAEELKRQAGQSRAAAARWRQRLKEAKAELAKRREGAE